MNYNDICNAPNHAGIYCIRNTVNGKCYIGKAIKLRNTLKQFWRELTTNTLLNKDISDLGIEKFDLNILYKIRDSLAYDTEKRLNLLEKEYIEKYDSKNNGYNIETIQESKLNSIPEIIEDSWVKCNNLQTGEQLVFKTVSEASQTLKIPEYNICKCLNKEFHITFKCWQFCYGSEEFETLPKYDSDDFKDLIFEWKRNISNKEEICDYIKANPNCSYGEIKQQFELSKKSFYSHKNEILNDGF